MSEERDSVNPGFNRRKFMRRAGITAAGVAVAATGADVLLESSSTAAREPFPVENLDPEGLLKPDPIAEENILAGEILSIGDGKLIIDSADSGSVEIELASHARIDREGPAPLSAYRPGDEVVVLGAPQDGTFIAVGIAPMFRTIKATVASREGPLLRTNNGKVLLTSRTVPKGWVKGERRVTALPLTDLKAGSEIKVMGLVNQKSRVMSASVIGLLDPYGSS